MKKEDIPIGWRLIKLGEYVEKQKGKKPKHLSTGKSDKLYLPYVDIKAFEEGVIVKYTDGEGCVICEDNDFLIVWDGSRSGLVGKAIRGALGSTLVRVNFPDGVLNNYAFYFLKSKYLEINSRAKGSGTPHVDPDLLWNYNFPLPPLPEQHRIVAKIEELFSELDNAVENLKKVKAQLKTYRQAVLKWAFKGKLTEEWRKERMQNEEVSLAAEIDAKYESLSEQKLPEFWKQQILGNLSDIRGGVTKGRKLNGKSTIFLPYLRVANVQDGFLDLREVKKIEVLDTDLEKYKLEYEDVLFTEGGDKDKLGRGTIWKNEIADCIHQNHIFRARIKDRNIFNPKYLTYYAQSPIGKDYFFKKAKQTVNLASINKTILSNLPVPICNINEQKQIILEIETRFSVSNKLEQSIDQSLQQAEALRQSILKRAFEGKLLK